MKTQWITRALLTAGLSWFVVGMIAVTANVAYAQSTGTFDMNGYLDRRLNVIDAQHLDARLRVLENDMFEIKWLSRTVTAAMIGTLIVTGMKRARENAGG